MAQSKAAGFLAGTDRSGRPYPPSWADRLVQWIDALPGPAYLAYLIMILLAALISHALRWSDGTLAFGSLSLIRFAETPLMVLPLAFMHFLSNQARRSFIEFRPALQEDEEFCSQAQYQLSITPSRGALVASLVGILLGGLSVAGDPDGYGVLPGVSWATLLYTVAFASLTFIFVSLLVYQTVRQLALVNRLHSMASNISLFMTRPVYAFSVLTSRTGIGMLVLVYFGSVVIFSANAGSPSSMEMQDFIVFTMVILLAVACFVVPLLGIHRRLSEERDRLLADVARRMQAAMELSRRSMDEQDYGSVERMHKVLLSLIAERDLLHKTSSWPWKPETLRGFASAILLPVFAWLATTLLGRIFGL